MFRCASLAIAAVLFRPPVDADLLKSGTPNQPVPLERRMATPHPGSGRPVIDPARVNDPRRMPVVGSGSRGAVVLRAQVLLDRAKFSCGEIDGTYGLNLRKAVAAFRVAHGLPPSGSIGLQDWAALNTDRSEALFQYAIAPDDVAGPFTNIPNNIEEQARLPALNYASALQGIAEKFHASPTVLVQLNPRKTFGKAGETVLVADVSAPVPPKASSVAVEGSERSVTALDAEGRIWLTIRQASEARTIRSPWGLGKSWARSSIRSSIQS